MIKHITPVMYNGQWCLVDENNDMVRVSRSFKNIWKLLAISGGNPVNAAIIGRENTFEPVGVWENEIYKSL